ncbi:MAG TPA: VOC family protein [Chitinophagaceae bacterium]
MKKQITPCLWFNGQAKEAAALYTAAFEDSKITGNSPVVSEIEISGQIFILLNGGPMYQPNPSISFYYIAESEEEVEKIWNVFGKEGSVITPLGKYPWSDEYGWITDKFGVSWQVALGNGSEVGQKITPCLLFTGKQYGKADDAIAHYTNIFKEVQVEGALRYGANENPDKEGRIKHAQVSVNGQKLMFMESAVHRFTFSEGISLTVYCETQHEIDYYWERLTESGAESMCGWLKDKFGVSWQIIPRMLGEVMSNPSKAGKAAKAFMSMKKLNIEQILQATIS